MAQSKYDQAKALFIELDNHDRILLTRELMQEGELNARMVLILHLEWLDQKYHDQRGDIGILATAGLSLGEKEIKSAKKRKGERAKKVIAAQTKSLLSTGVFRGTEFEKQLNNAVDGIEFDSDWYESSWKLKSMEANDDTK